MDKSLFDYPQPVQNEIIKSILLDKSGFLQTSGKLKDALLYSIEYNTMQTEGWDFKTLGKLLLILVERGFLLPMAFVNPELSRKAGLNHFFIFKEDLDQLPNEKYELIEYYDIHELAKTLQN